MLLGQVASTSLIEPIIIFAIIFIGNTITLFVLPITIIATTLSIISNLSDKIQIGKLSSFLKKGIVWTLGVAVTTFVSLLSLEGTLTSKVDAITAKSIKTAASTFIPVVGKALSESVDIVFGASNILKNSIGIIGMVVVIGICILPIIKLATLTIVYHFAAAVCEPVADKKVVSLLEQIGDTFKVLLGIMFFVSIMLIIGLAICIKITSS